MDGDDIASLDRIEKLLNYLDNNDLDLVSSFTLSIDEDGNEIGKNVFPITTKDCIRTMHLASVCSHNWLCKKELYESLNGYREIPSVEDFDFLQRALIRGFKVGNMPFWGMKIRVRNGNTLSTYGLRSRLSFNYVNYINRKKINFNESDFNQYLNKGSFIKFLHFNSDKLLLLYINTKSFRPVFSKITLLLSVFLSPYQLKKIIDRLKLKHNLKEVKYTKVDGFFEMSSIVEK